ncbi:prenyltransferase [bacterium]|nr:prenyltransferase [bacterium]
MRRRKRFLCLVSAATAVVLGVAAHGQEVTPRAPDQPRAAEIDGATRAAITRGLDYLARHQEPDGSWIDGIGRKVNNTYLAHPGKHVGVTALAGISFLAQGSTPSRGQYGKQVQGALDFILKSVSREGFITNDSSRMYEHAFATLFLAEVAGMAPSSEIHDALRAAVSCIVAAQNDQGGWRYLPGAKDSDISITVCQVQALRAARNVGIHVPKDAISNAIKYVKHSYIGDKVSYPHYKGGFWYQAYENRPFRPSRTSFALTAAGVTALYGAGEYDCEEIRGGLKYLFHRQNRPAANDMHHTFDYWYGHYYAIQAFFQAGEPFWTEWYLSVRDELVEGQAEHGDHWQDLVGPSYATAMATLILQIPYRYLPIFER